MSDTFLDTRGVTHEALELSYRHGVISLCGQLRARVSDVGRETVQLRVFAYLRPPEGVDCMTCMTRRARLGFQDTQPRMPMIELLVRVTSWG